MKRNDLMSYAANFASFLIKRKPKINKIILFGSVARNDFDDESDIDLFIDTELNEKEVKAILELYEVSEDNKKFLLEGIKNKIRLKIGSLDKWKSLKRSIISDGIILYGKYKEVPEDITNYVLFKILVGDIKRNNKVKIWRKLYGYKQKANKRTYYSEGLVKQNKGKKLAPGLFLMPAEKSQELVEFLRRNKINYELKEMFGG